MNAIIPCCAALLLASSLVPLLPHRGAAAAQQSAAPAQKRPLPESGRRNVVNALFTHLDANQDGSLARAEMRAGFDAWFTAWDGAKKDAVGFQQLYGGLNGLIPAQMSQGPQIQSQTPRQEDVQAMMAALPERAPAKPQRPRRVLVLARAVGFVHSTIPLAARTIEEMGKKTGAWSTTITYDAADINGANLEQFDAIFLASTTGEFLDDPDDAAATAARRRALLDFVRGGKGLAGIHAASDGYHRNAAAKDAPFNWGILTLVLQMMEGDTSHDGVLSRAELTALADRWYDTLDPGKTGRIARAEFPARWTALPMPPSSPTPQGPATDRTPDNEVGTWPEFNRMLGAFFKWHWNDGQAIPVKLDEPQHPLNAPFKGQGHVIVDETYTFSRNTYSRENLRVLKSIDYDKMSAEDKAKEQYPRTDGDYALSWIRREGKGRVFYEAHGHNEQAYANRLLLEHALAGVQYVLGDLPAEDSPSVRK